MSALLEALRLRKPLPVSLPAAGEPAVTMAESDLRKLATQLHYTKLALQAMTDARDDLRQQLRAYTDPAMPRDGTSWADNYHVATLQACGIDWTCVITRDDDDGTLIHYVQIGTQWAEPVETLSIPVFDALCKAADAYGIDDDPAPAAYDSTASDEAAACTYQRELDARASQ